MSVSTVAKARHSAAQTRTAADVMTPSPRTCSRFSTITEAALILRDENCAAVPVLDDGKPVGFLTDRDVALATTRFSDLLSRPVSEVMTQQTAVTVPADASLEALREKFTTTKADRLLVVDTGGHLAGVVTWADLIPHLPVCEVGPVVAEVIDRPLPAAPPRMASRVHQAPRASGSRARANALWDLLRTTTDEWMEDKVPRLGAALAFYSALSVAPLVLIAIAVAGFVFGREAAQGQLIGEIRSLVGTVGAEAIQTMIANAGKPRTGTLAAVIGVATLLLGASGVFGELQDAMNTIAEVQPKPGRGILGIIKARFFSFAMVLGTGFLLLVSLLLSAVLAAFFGYAGRLLPGLVSTLQMVNTLVSFAVVFLLFAMIFKLLPDARIAWRDVWVGSLLTTILFMAGKALIGLYLGRSSVGTSYGAAGSLVALLIWIYYSAQILFFGAEFTKVYANRYGLGIRPRSYAQPVTAEARAQQGIPKATV